MHDVLMSATLCLPAASGGLLAAGALDVLSAIWPYVLIVLGFSAVIFVHELGHYLLAKWADVRVDKFCIGFGRELFGFTSGETRYGFNILPLGGYVKMLGQEDFDVDSRGDLTTRSDDPRSFANKPVGTRMAIVSGGVIMNVVFAAFLFMIVFMVGLEVGVTEIGFVKPNSPAALGGLQVGDNVVRVNGKKISEFSEMNMAIMLADPHRPMDFEIERQGQIKHLKLQPENSEERGVLMVGMGPAMTNRVVAAPPGADPKREDLPRPGDTIVEVDGEAVTERNANEVYLALVADPARMRQVIVERPQNPEVADSPVTRVQVEVLPTLYLNASDPLSTDLINVLGLSPLMRVDFVSAGGRAERAGLEVGDTVMRIGQIDYPNRVQIATAIKDACTRRTGPGDNDFDYQEADIPIVVQRRGQAEPISLTLRPKVRLHLFGRNGFPQAEATFDLIANDLLRVGEIVPEIDGRPTPVISARFIIIREIDARPTPAAVAGIPAGALITKVNDVEVATWIDLVEQLRTHAGQSVTMAYLDREGQPGSGDMPIPHCLRTKLGLPAGSEILAIDGDESVNATLRDKERSISVSHWFGLKTRLAQSVGQTVTVRYKRGFLAAEETASAEITEDMIDPWLGRIAYLPNLRTAQGTKLLRTSNPAEAVSIGVRKTKYFILNVYHTMKRMIFTRTVGVENLSGPVGIVKLGSDMASIGLNQLLWFLAVISANLAVINFLPLPIVDGGLMVFLLIEKIKGTPVSVKTQMVTQVLGLVLIISLFLYVTIQDLQRLFG